MSTPLPKHFWLGGSIAARALACPGSLRHKNDGTSSAAADRGSMLHEVVVGLQTGRWERPEHAVGFQAYGQRLTTGDAKRAALPAWRAVQTWLDGRPAMYEQMVRFRSIKNAGGTADVLTEDGILDLKFGSRGVSVENNKQLLFYLAAAVESKKIPKRPTYRLAIVQPAIDVRPLEDTATYDDLIEITAGLKTAVKASQADKPKLSPGEHCTFCPGRRTCTARLDSGFAALKAALKINGS